MAETWQRDPMIAKRFLQCGFRAAMMRRRLGFIGGMRDSSNIPDRWN
jgi:hypothetical protein